MSAPLVSVVIPAYNAAPYIAETLESVLRQTHPCVEIVVVDDGSTDDTPDRLQAYRSVIRCIRQGNAGQGAARGAGIRASSGEYIALLDADDLWAPETLEIQVAVAQRHPESGLIVCDGVQFCGPDVLRDRLVSGSLADRLSASAAGELTGWFYRELVRDSGLCCPAQTLIPRRVVDEVGLPPTREDAEAEDWGYVLRIALRYPITLHRHSLVRYRYHPSSAAGPLELRALKWALVQIPTLRRHLSLCAPEDRPLVAGTLRRLARDRALEAYLHGRRCDLRSARTYLARLRKVTPEEPLIALWWLATWVPGPLDVAVRHVRRAARSRWRRGLR